MFDLVFLAGSGCLLVISFAGRMLKMLISGAFQALLILLVILGVSDLDKLLTTSIKLWHDSSCTVCATKHLWGGFFSLDDQMG